MTFRMPYLSAILTLFMVLLISANWPIGCTGESPSAELSGQYHIGWVWPDSLPPLESILAAGKNGRIYVTDSNGTLCCLQSDGEIAWKNQGISRKISRPAIADSFLCFAVADEGKSGKYDYLVALNLSGEILWKFSGDSKLWGLPLISPQGNVYIQTTTDLNNQGAFRISENGEGKLIEWPDGIYPGCFLGFDSTENIILWESHEKQLHTISDKGELISSCFFEGVPRYKSQTPNIVDFILSPVDNDRLIKTDNKCDTIWNRKKDKPFRISCLTYLDASNNLFIGTREGALSKLDAETGSSIWDLELGAEFGEIEDLMLSSKEIAFVTGSWQKLAAIDGGGNLIWQYTMYDAGNISKSILTTDDELLIIQEGRLYAFTQDPKLFVLQKESVPVPSSKSDAEDEIIEFMLDDIVEQIEFLSGWLREKEHIKDQPYYSPPESDLIIYTHPEEDSDRALSPVRSGEPVRVWLYDHLQLIEAEDKERAVDEYNEKMKDGKAVPWAYGTYKFGMKFVNNDLTQAQVYLDHYCGGLCGSGSQLFLQRSPSGEWWAVKIDPTWIS